MIRGIGVDTVDIRRIERMLEKEPEPAFFRRVYTEKEKEMAPKTANLHVRAEYYAARFAAKEAVFKALGHLTSEKTFDLCMVETLHHPDGSPYVNTDGPLAPVLAAADVEGIHLSITTEGDYATAFEISYINEKDQR